MTGSRHDQWFKSTFSGSTCACVEVRFVDGWVDVRDTKAVRATGVGSRSAPYVTFDQGAWDELVQALRAGCRTVECEPGPIFRVSDDGTAALEDRSSGLVLSFTASETDAFLAGVQEGEFDLSEEK